MSHQLTVTFSLALTSPPWLTVVYTVWFRCPPVEDGERYSGWSEGVGNGAGGIPKLPPRGRQTLVYKCVIALSLERFSLSNSVCHYFHATIDTPHRMGTSAVTVHVVDLFALPCLSTSLPSCWDSYTATVELHFSVNVTILCQRKQCCTGPGHLKRKSWPGCSWLVCLALPFYLATKLLRHAVV